MPLVQWVAPWGALVGLVFFIIGLVVQDWDCQDCSELTGGGYDDITWGTIATDWGLTAAYLPMAILAPGTGAMQAAFRGAAALDAVGWCFGGFAHLVKAVTGEFYVALFIVSTVGTTIGSTMRLFGTVLAMQSVGLCACIQSTRALGAIFGTVALSAAVLLPTAEVGVIPVPGWILAAVYQITLVLLFIICSTAAIVDIRAGAVWAPVVAFLMFMCGVLVNQIKPSPFKYSTGFNDNALFHVFFIWEAAASFQALRVLAEPLVDEPDTPLAEYVYGDWRSQRDDDRDFGSSSALTCCGTRLMCGGRSRSGGYC